MSMLDPFASGLEGTVAEGEWKGPIVAEGRAEETEAAAASGAAPCNTGCNVSGALA